MTTKECTKPWNRCKEILLFVRKKEKIHSAWVIIIIIKKRFHFYKPLSNAITVIVFLHHGLCSREGNTETLTATDIFRNLKPWLANLIPAANAASNYKFILSPFQHLHASQTSPLCNLVCRKKIDFTEGLEKSGTFLFASTVFSVPFS